MDFLDLWLNQLGLESQFWHPITSLSLFVGAIILAILLNKVVFPLILRFTNFTPTHLDVRLVRCFRRPATLATLLAGAYFALVLPFEFDPSIRHLLDRGAAILALLIGVFAVSGAVSNLFEWYYEEISHHTSSTLDDRLMPMLRRFANVLIFALGGLLALDLLNINISPLIAGLGLGGLAVALALQPTLSNLFAGTYVMTEGVVTQGDYIELESGVAGYVVDVGWRSTRLRTWTNNLVVVPNSRFAETIITNYQGPIPAVNIYLVCGVSLQSDLHLVERVCREVMEELLDTDPRAVKEYGSYFAYQSFDDSNISFYLFIQARDRLASFEVQSELIRMVHDRFRDEGIVINYPMRTINFDRREPALDEIRFRASGNMPASEPTGIRPGPGRQQGQFDPHEAGTEGRPDSGPGGSGEAGEA